MTLNELQELCENEWKKALGDVTEIHLTDDEYEELKKSFALEYRPYSYMPDLSGVTNSVTGTFIKIVRLRSKAVVKRTKAKTPPTYEVPFGGKLV